MVFVVGFGLVFAFDPSDYRPRLIIEPSDYRPGIEPDFVFTIIFFASLRFVKSELNEYIDIDVFKHAGMNGEQKKKDVRITPLKSRNVLLLHTCRFVIVVLL